MTPAPDIAALVARMEKENRNLISRVESLEKRRGSTIAAAIANFLLIVNTGLLAGYLGLFPSRVQRLPLDARSVAS